MPYLSVIDAQKTVHDLRDEIARILADEEWNAETAGRIADLLIANGRDLTHIRMRLDVGLDLE